jgi:hypothetical protein
LSAAIPHVASRRTTAPCPVASLSRADVVPSEAAEGCVSWCGWHGMQGVRGSNPLSSTPGQRPSPPSTARESAPSRSRYAATACARPMRSSRDGGDAGDHCGSRLSVDPAHGTAAGGVVGAAAGVAHQLVDHPGGDGGVLQPGREGMPQVMGAPQVRVASPAPAALHGGLVDPPQVVGGQWRSSAARDAVATTGPREDQVLGAGLAGSRSSARSNAPRTRPPRPRPTPRPCGSLTPTSCSTPSRATPKSRTRPPAPTTSSLPGASPSRSRSCRSSTFRQPAQAAPTRSAMSSGRAGLRLSPPSRCSEGGHERPQRRLVERTP